jgi:hypothetical protein
MGVKEFIINEKGVSNLLSDYTPFCPLPVTMIKTTENTNRANQKNRQALIPVDFPYDNTFDSSFLKKLFIAWKTSGFCFRMK